jgi:sensor histidine kinase YesM
MWYRWRFVAGVYLLTCSMFAVQRAILDLQQNKPGEIFDSLLDLLYFSLIWVALAIPTLILSGRRKLSVSVAAQLVGLGLLFTFIHAAAYLCLTLLTPDLAAGVTVRNADEFLSTLLGLNYAWRFLSYGFIVVLAYAYDYYQLALERGRRTAELEAQLAEAKLQALKMQLQPHFLFNALNAVSVLIDEDPQSAREMIGQMSDLLRLVLEYGNAQEVPLRRELEFLDRYLLIERTRYGGRLTIDRQIDPDTLDVFVPYLILQPLVENAIRHGIASVPGPGTIGVTARRRNGQLELSVRDTGPGMRGTSRAGSGMGIGLTNTRARLHQLYGADQALNIAGLDEGGFVVEILLPYKSAPGTPPA